MAQQKKLWRGIMKVITNRVSELLAAKKRREKRKISQRVLAEELKMSTSTVNALMNNSIGLYSKDTLLKLCLYFDCTPGDLLVIEEVDDAST